MNSKKYRFIYIALLIVLFIILSACVKGTEEVTTTINSVVTATLGSSFTIDPTPGNFFIENPQYLFPSVWGIQ